MSSELITFFLLDLLLNYFYILKADFYISDSWDGVRHEEVPSPQSDAEVSEDENEVN